jgi:NADPH:quinone reductase
MRSIRIEQYGGPEVLLRREVPVPEPRPDEVLIKVAYAGINFMDVHTREGKYANSSTYPVRLPCTLGMEGAGVIMGAGGAVNSHMQGERVAWCISWGSYAEYSVVPAAKVAKLPDALSFEQAAAAMFPGCTAHYLVHDAGRLRAGMSCLIHAASGGIGQILIQLCKRLGVKVFATTSSDAKAHIARGLGADHVMMYEGFADVVRKMTSGKGVDVVFDPLGLATLRGSLRATRTRGLIVNYGAVSGAVRDLDPLELGEAGSLFLTRPRLADHMADAATVQRRADDIFAALLDGTLTIPISGTYTLDSVEQAHAALEERQQIGKAVLKIG